MAAIKHTPGPWELLAPNPRGWNTHSFGVQAPTPEGPGFPTPSATGHFAMACPPPHGRDKADVQEANARLIAAAPDLLAALLAFMPELDQRERFISANDSAWSQSEIVMLERIRNARAALTKAGA